MGSSKDYQKILSIAGAFKKKLEEVSEDTFQLNPPSGGWSYSEVYFHIFDASLLTLDTIEDCIAGKGENKPTPFISKLILSFGALPPGGKYKAPRRLAERLKKISKTEAEELINIFLAKLDTLSQKLPAADKNIKTPHPRMGHFNAFQWFRFMRIHLAHHLKQIIRIEKEFKFTSLQP
jgi:DinB family protein